MVDKWARSKRLNGQLSFIRGGVGSITPPDIISERRAIREALILGSYNPLLNAGPTPESKGARPWELEFPSTNRVGILGNDTITNKVEVDVVETTAGKLLENTIFYGKLEPKAAGIKMRNCVVVGNPEGSTECSRGSSSLASNIIYEDVTFVTQSPARWASGSIVGTAAHLYDRCDFFGLSDAITPSNRWIGGVTVKQSAFHNMYMLGPDPGAAGRIIDGQTHVDQTQMVGGSFSSLGSGYLGLYTADPLYMQGAVPARNFGGTQRNPLYHWLGNRYVNNQGNALLHTTSCIMMSPATYPLDRVILTDNWFDGSSYPINCAGMSSAIQFDFGRNHVGNNRRDETSHFAIIANASLRPQINIFDNVDLNGNPLSRAQLLKAG